MDFENIYSTKKPYDKAFLGGTFDRFHHAHVSLIKTAVVMAEHVFIGVVSDQLGAELFRNKIEGDRIQSYKVRSNSVISYISGLTDSFTVEALLDPWGPAPHDSTSNGALVVSRETEVSGDRINTMRVDNGLSPLDVIVIPWVKDNHGEAISSTRLRLKEIE